LDFERIPARIFRRVLFPQPLGPTTAIKEPCGTWKDTFSRALSVSPEIVWKVLLTSLTRIRVSIMAFPSSIAIAQ
jgi:hypothetical protein